jgi:hypothetical protein
VPAGIVGHSTLVSPSAHVQEQLEVALPKESGGAGGEHWLLEIAIVKAIAFASSCDEKDCTVLAGCVAIKNDSIPGAHAPVCDRLCHQQVTAPSTKSEASALACSLPPADSLTKKTSAGI